MDLSATCNGQVCDLPQASSWPVVDLFWTCSRHDISSGMIPLHYKRPNQGIIKVSAKEIKHGTHHWWPAEIQQPRHSWQRCSQEPALLNYNKTVHITTQLHYHFATFMVVISIKSVHSLEWHYCKDTTFQTAISRLWNSLSYSVTSAPMLAIFCRL